MIGRLVRVTARQGLVDTETFTYLDTDPVTILKEN